jgi:hypothetical protein
MEEVWREIPGFEGYYEVSTDGRIRGVERRVKCPFDKHIIIKSKPKSVSRFRTGYLYVNLYKEHKTYKRLIHRLVAEAFVPNENPSVFNQVNHRDENKENNRADNLEWCDGMYNTHYGTAIERMRERRWGNAPTIIPAEEGE